MSDPLEDFFSEGELATPAQAPALTPAVAAAPTPADAAPAAVAPAGAAAAPAALPARVPPELVAEGLSLKRLEELNAALSWRECVAIMRGYCEAVCATGDTVGPAVIDLDAVVLYATGVVWTSAVGPRDGRRAARAVAELFRARLQEAEAPTQLMLVLSLSSLCTSLEEFSKSIERFHQRDTAALIRGVYKRYASPASTPSMAKLLEESATRTPFFRRFAWPSTARISVAGGLVILVVVGGLALWSMRRTAAAPPAARVSPALPATTAAPRAIVEEAAPVVERVQSPAIVSSPPRVKASRPPTPGAASIELPSELRPAVTAPQSEPPVILAQGPTVSGLPVPVDVPEVAVQLQALSPDLRVYSADDTDVVPPVAIYPQFPSTRPAGVAPNKAPEFEAVVGESGRVESVRARRAPATIAEATIVIGALSAAKTWRFRPALRNGVPVKYRKVLWVVTN